LNFLKFTLLAAFAAILLYGASHLPSRASSEIKIHDLQSMTGTPVPGNHYIRNAYKDAKTPNMVTVILGDYRSVDTLGEETVVLTAGLVILLVLRGRSKDA